MLHRAKRVMSCRWSRETEFSEYERRDLIPDGQLGGGYHVERNRVDFEVYVRRFRMWKRRRCLRPSGASGLGGARSPGRRTVLSESNWAIVMGRSGETGAHRSGGFDSVRRECRGLVC